MFTVTPGGLIVSCQPSTPDSPLNRPEHMAAMALAAEKAGAVALRVDSPEHVAAVRAACSLPIIGLWKRQDDRSNRIITPDVESARALAAAGADVIALDATAANRPVPGLLAQLIRAVKAEVGRPVMADVANLAEGIRAAGYGADLVGTTLSGYVPGSPVQPGPDLDLVRELSASVEVPVIAEGRYHTPAQARAALEAGAAMVVVGGAITAPDLITARFVAGMKRPPSTPATAEAYWAEAAVAVARVQATQAPAIREAAALCAQAIAAGGAVRTVGPALPEAPFHPADVFVVTGNAGPKATELAVEARRRGHQLVAITSRHHHTGLGELADVVIDDGAPVGELSAVTGVLIAGALKAEIAAALGAAGESEHFRAEYQ